MVQFPITQTAFEGFRLTREHPRLLLYGAALMLAAYLASIAIGVVMIGADWAELRATQPMDDPGKALALLSRLAPFYVVTGLVGAVAGVVVQCAIYRVVFRPEDPGYFRLGADEARVLAATVLALLGLMAAGLVLGVAIGIVGGLVGGPVRPLLQVLAIAVSVWLGLRFMLVGPQTFAERRIALLGSWKLTRGAAVPLAGTYLLVFALAVVVALLVLTIVVAAVALVGGLAEAGALFQADYTSFATAFAPRTVVGQAVFAAIVTLATILVGGPAAVAYRLLANRTQGTAA